MPIAMWLAGLILLAAIVVGSPHVEKLITAFVTLVAYRAGRNSRESLNSK
jgi:hypothetical protein